MDALKQFLGGFDLVSELIALFAVIIVGLLTSPRCRKSMGLPTKIPDDEPE